MTTHLPGNLLPLTSVKLGRFVLDVKDPAKNFHDPLEGRSSVADFRQNSYTNFSDTRVVSKVLKLRFSLSDIFSIHHERESTKATRISAPQAMSYCLIDPNAWFQRSCVEPATQEFLERAINKRKNVYLIAGFHTVQDARLDRDVAQKRVKGVEGRILDVLAPRAVGKRNTSDSQEFTSNFPGEHVFAILYGKVKCKWFSSRAVLNMSLEGNRLESLFDWKVDGGNKERGVVEAKIKDDSDLEISDDEYDNVNDAKPSRGLGDKKGDPEIAHPVQGYNLRVAKTTDKTDSTTLIPENPTGTPSSLRMTQVNAKLMEVKSLEDISLIISLGLAVYNDRNKQVGRWWLDIETLATGRYEPGVYHLAALTAMANRVEEYQNIGQWKKAEELGIEVIIARKGFLGLDHLDTLESMATLALVYRSQKRWNEAEEIWRDVLQRSERVLGVNHPCTLRASVDLTKLYDEKNLCEKVGGGEREKEWQEVRVRSEMVGMWESEGGGWEREGELGREKDIKMWDGVVGMGVSESEGDGGRERDLERELGGIWRGRGGGGSG